jgi:uncharacterized protein (TIGR00645 family)
MNKELNKAPCSDRTFLQRLHESLYLEMPRWFDEVVFHSRWLLYPAVIGLGLVDVALLASFCRDAWLFVLSVWHYLYLGDKPELTISTFDLVEQALKMTIVTLVSMGIHQIYIRRFREDRQIHDIPQWLDHIDTVFLKVKVGLALTLVSLVQLLQDGPAAVPYDVWLRHCVNTIIFAVCTLVFALIWRLVHPPHPAHPVDIKRINGNNSNGASDRREEAEVEDRSTNN